MKNLRTWTLWGMAFVLGIGVWAVGETGGNLVSNPNFAQKAGAWPAGYTLSGDAYYDYLGAQRHDASTWGAILPSAKWNAQGEVAQIVAIAPGMGRAYRFDIRGMALNHFDIASGGVLRMRVDFLGDGEKTYDGKSRDIYAEIQRARQDLAVNGDKNVGGAAAWRTYSMEFTVPFAEVRRLKLSVRMDKGGGAAGDSDFYISEFELTPLAVGAAAAVKEKHGEVVSVAHLLPIGGRWYYAADDGETKIPQQFDAGNSDRLIYDDGQYETPFAGNMSSWLRAGDRDLSGNIVTRDIFVRDNVVVRFDKTSMIIHTHNLPNHPTGKFPQTGFGLLNNPNYITEQDETYFIPLYPKERVGHTVTDLHNTNHALNMGPIGIATNGVVFFNPFDANSTDASNFMDACCGHPNQDGMYHYHKYPICINTPWSDDGENHSGILGWAFDGFPIYGPYESKGVMAKDSGKLNAFNMDYDDKRGWHYHVTPGKFPYIIGGYWGTADRRDLRGARGMGGGPPGGMDGPPPIPWDAPAWMMQPPPRP